jgi:hypothetical protein
VLVLSAVGMLAAAGFVHAQTVTVDMADVTIREVTRELAAQTGYRFNYSGQEWPSVIPELKAVDRPLKEVLREACLAAGYRYRRLGTNMFQLEAGAFQESPYMVEVEGYRISLDRASLHGGGRTVDFVDGAGQVRPFPPSLNVTLGVDAPTAEACALIRGFEGISICDDQDRVYFLDEAQAQSQLRDHFRLHPGPDYGTVPLRFEDVALDMTALRYLSGAIVLADSLETIEVRFDDPQQDQVKEAEGYTVKISRLEMTESHLNLGLDMSVPEGMGWAERQKWTRSQLEVRYDDDSVYRTDLGSAWGSAGFGIGWGREDKRVVAIVYRAFRPTDEERLVPLRIEDIPLPE